MDDFFDKNPWDAGVSLVKGKFCPYQDVGASFMMHLKETDGASVSHQEKVPQVKKILCKLVK